MWIQTTVSVADLAGTSAEVVPDGVAALDGRGAALAVEVSRHRVLVIDIENRRREAIVEAGVMPLTALAVHLYGGLLAAASEDGCIVLHDLYAGKTRHKIDMSTESLSVLAFSPDSRLLAAGDNDGHIVMYHVGSGEEVRRFDSEMRVRALALDTFGTLAIGDAAGRVRVQRNLLPPLELAGNGRAVTALALGPRGMKPLAGRSDGSIDQVDLAWRGLSAYLRAEAGPIRALAFDPETRAITAFTGNDQLCSWVRDYDWAGVFRTPVEAADRGADQLVRWWRELRPLVAGFGDVRELLRSDIADERADMLNRLDGLDEATRERIRPVVIDSAISIYNSFSFDLAVRTVFKVNPLPRVIRTVAAAFVILLLPAVLPSPTAYARTAGGWVVVVALVSAGIWLARMLNRLGAVGRAVRFVMTVACIAVVTLGPHILISEPRGARQFTGAWFRAASHLKIRLDIPPAVWLGLFYLAVYLAAGELARRALGALRAPSARVERRRVLGGSLLHALLDVAYQAKIMADDPDVAASPVARWHLHHEVQVAAGIACGQWVHAMEVGSRKADRVIREQGRAIAIAIRRWEPDIALGGALLPMLSEVFTVAVVNAADCDWKALGADPASIPRHHTSRLIAQALALVVPLGLAAGILFAVHPLPAALAAPLTLLIALVLTRVLRWLDLGGDIDSGLKISELMRKPG